MRLMNYRILFRFCRVKIGRYVCGVKKDVKLNENDCFRIGGIIILNKIEKVRKSNLKIF